MKSMERHTENGADARVVVPSNNLHVAYKSPAFQEKVYATVKQEMKFEGQIKIDRRYSFDDNGGGYQGL